MPDRRVLRRSSAGRGGEEDPVVVRAVAAAQAGDRDAFRYLYARYADGVCRYVGQILGDLHEAEDVTQQVFAKLLGVIGRYEPRGLPFGAWLGRVARNAALDALRARRCRPSIYGEPDPSVPAFEQAGASVLHEALSLLPDDQRSVLYLRHVVGLTPPEIAERLGKSESAVHGLHHRGRRALRLELERLGAAPATRPD